MAEILDFPESRKIGDGEETPPDAQWTCKCHCTTFHLLADGGIVCANCQTRSTGIDTGLWMIRLPAPIAPANPDISERPPEDNIIDMNSPVRGIEALLTRYKPEQIALLAVLRSDGGIQLWGMDNVDSDEQVKWVRRKLDAIIDMLRPRNVG